MSKKIQDVMAKSIITVDVSEGVDAARARMVENDIHHLPVLDGDNLIGVVSDRDLKLAVSLKDLSSGPYGVRDVYVADPYQVAPDTSLSEVLGVMHERRIGSALVVDNGKVVGIFTALDALRVLRDELEGN